MTVSKNLNRVFVLVLTSIFVADLSAATFTVGAGGSHGTIQAAINAALLAGGENEIRVRAGTYIQDLSVSNALSSGSLTLTGGWNAGFTSRDGDPAVTIVDAGGFDSALTVTSSGGELTVSGFTFTHGERGMRLEPTGGVVEVSGNIISGNHRVTSLGADGGGIFALVSGTAQLRIIGNAITSNRATSTGQVASGGGVFITTGDAATLSFRSNTVEDNESVSSAGQATGAGFYIRFAGTGTSDFVDNFVLENQTVAEPGDPSTFPGGVVASDPGADNVVTVSRNEFRGNVSNGYQTEQVAVISDGGSLVRLRDSLFAGGPGGVLLWQRGASTLRATNLTVASNELYGIRTLITGTGPLSVYNSIMFDNVPGGDFFPAAGTDSGANLIGVDPIFVDAGASNYRLQAGSPAINQGTNSPPGGLSGRDLAGDPRVSGTSVDIGAYEFDGPLAFDPNGDGIVTASDVFYLINFLFASGADPIGGADANGDGSVTASDVFFLINYLFAGGPAPA